MIAELVAAQTAVVTETNAVGAAGGTAEEVLTLVRDVTGDNGNGGTYTGTVEIRATIHVTQSGAAPSASSSGFPGGGSGKGIGEPKANG